MDEVAAIALVLETLRASSVGMIMGSNQSAPTQAPDPADVATFDSMLSSVDETTPSVTPTSVTSSDLPISLGEALQTSAYDSITQVRTSLQSIQQAVSPMANETPLSTKEMLQIQYFIQQSAITIQIYTKMAGTMLQNVQTLFKNQ